MRYVFLLTLMVFMAIAVVSVNAQMYEYRDSDGNIRFTDDLGTVPEDKRENARRIRAVPEYSSPFEQKEPPAETEETVVNADGQGEVDQAETEADLFEKGEVLRREQAELQAEYEGIQEEKMRIGDPPNDDATLAEFEAYGEKVDQINDRIRAYQEKLKDHKQRVKAYNARFEE